jgi:hypothetical protein
MGFYVTTTATAINYTNGSGTEPAAQNQDMTLPQGIGLSYPFGTVFSPRVWNGTIYYYSTPGLAYCFGDGSGSICPCGNMGVGEEGCQNSLGRGGVLLPGGSASVALDNLSFTALGMPSSRPALLITGTTHANGGLGASFGDGFLCAGGSTVKLGVQITGMGGEASWGAGLLSSGGLQSGTSQFFQVLYRDSSAMSPCGMRFNGTNGVEIALLP